MQSLDVLFHELMERMKQGRNLENASFDPVYYLIFDPSKILELKRSIKAWTVRLKNEGWDVFCFSVAEQIASILSSAPQRKIWLAADRKSPQNWEKTNQSLANLLNQGALLSRFKDIFENLRDHSNAILFVTDLEALHPYMRIGAIENQLYGHFYVPTVFFYPGVRTGKTRLRFLGFYPEDGNYRSVHVGG